MRKTDELKRKFRHIPEIIMNLGEVEIADLEIAEDYVEHIAMPPGFPPNRQGFKDFVIMLRTAFPDLHYEVDHLTTNDLVGENQKVVHRITAHATHLGPWGSVPATGKRMTWTEIHIGLYVQGLLVEHWGTIDTLSIMQQMGAIPGWHDRPPAPPRLEVTGTKTTTHQENIGIVRRYIHDVWNKGRLEVADELFHPRSIDPALPQLPSGPEGVKQAVVMYRSAFPKLYMFVQDVIADEDLVVIRFTLAGTHQGVFMEIPATGRDIEMEGCAIFHFGDGQIIERWHEADLLGLFGQLGLGG
jgi:predicted ester cyclase